MASVYTKPNHQQLLIHYNRALYYYAKGTGEKQPEKYLHVAISIADRGKFTNDTILLGFLIAQYYLENESPERAMPYVFEGIELVENTNRPQSKWGIYRNATIYFQQIGDYSNSELYLKMASASVNELIFQNAAIFLGRDLGKLLTVKPDQKAGIKEKNGAWFFYFSASIAILLLICIFLLVRKRKLTQKLHTLLENDEKSSVLIQEKDVKISDLNSDLQVQIKKNATTRNEFDQLTLELNSLLQDLNRTNEALSSSKMELELSNVSKDKFFSIISHDLKNPIAAIMSLSEIISDEFDIFDRATIQKYIKNMSESAKSLFDLLQNLLNWSRLNLGTMHFSPTENQIEPIVDVVLDTMKAHAGIKKINLKKVGSYSPTLEFDENMINTVIRNLVSNAIKFTHKDGYVQVSLKAIQGGVHVSVRDNGVGIPADKIDKLFQIDSRHGSVGTANETGTGLGLLLCQEFLLKHGTGMVVKSKIDEGSEFSFTIHEKLEDAGIEKSSNDKVFDNILEDPATKFSKTCPISLLV